MAGGSGGEGQVGGLRQQGGKQQLQLHVRAGPEARAKARAGAAAAVCTPRLVLESKISGFPSPRKLNGEKDLLLGKWDLE